MAAAGANLTLALCAHAQCVTGMKTLNNDRMRGCEKQKTLYIGIDGNLRFIGEVGVLMFAFYVNIQIF